MASQEDTPTDLDNPAYDGTRGHSGSDTSRDAAYADVVNGVTNKTQRLVLILAAQAGARGITIAEAREAKGGLHHGRMSSALTKQHIAGRLVALHERRGHCGVYVLPEHVNGRDVRPYRRQRKPINEEIIVGVLLEHRYIESTRNSFSRCIQDDWHGDGHRGGWNQHIAQKIAEALS